MSACKAVQQGGRQIICTDLGNEQQYPKLCTAQQALPHCQYHKRGPGADAGGQERIRFLHRELSVLDCLCRRTGRGGKTAQKPNAEHPRRTGCMDADTTRHKPEWQCKKVAFRALDEQT